MHNKSVKEIVLSGLFLAIGLLLPMFFHIFGLGSTFLPMHIPVLLAGFVLSLPFAVAIGVLTPILSAVLTGMPPMFPVLPYMVFELATYAAVSCILYKRLKLNVYLSLVGSMVAGRVVSGVIVWILATFFMAKLPSPVVFITANIVQGIPGLVIQILFIPVLVMILSKVNLITREAITSES